METSVMLLEFESSAKLNISENIVNKFDGITIRNYDDPWISWK